MGSPGEQDAAVGKTADESAAVLAERWRRIRSPRTLLFFLLSLALLVVLVWKLDLPQAIDSLRSVHLGWLLAACLTYGIATGCKAARYGAMLQAHDLAPLELFAVTSYQNLYNQILPARTGELTLIYYLRRFSRAPAATAVHVLVITRVYDFIVVALFFVASVALRFGGRSSTILALAGIGVLLVAVVVLLGLGTIVPGAAALAHRAATRLGWGTGRRAQKVLQGLDSVAGEFGRYRVVRNAPALVLTSVLVWLALYAFAYLTLLAYHVDIDVVSSVAGSTGQVLANVLPINSFGSFGTLEAGWAGGYMLAGLDRQTAITTGFGYHLINFVAAAFLGGLAALLLRRWGRRSAAPGKANRLGR